MPVTIADRPTFPLLSVGNNKKSVMYKICFMNSIWRALLSNGTLKILNNRDIVFCGVRAATVAIQWLGKHVSTVDAMFSVGSVQRSYLKNKRRCGSR
jgi:hypothetical protein